MAPTEIRVDLAATPIGPNEAAIAGDGVLVTNNKQELARVLGLVLKDLVN